MLDCNSQKLKPACRTLVFPSNRDVSFALNMRALYARRRKRKKREGDGASGGSEKWCEAGRGGAGARTRRQISLAPLEKREQMSDSVFTSAIFVMSEGKHRQPWLHWLVEHVGRSQFVSLKFCNARAFSGRAQTKWLLYQRICWK